MNRNVISKLCPRNRCIRHFFLAFFLLFCIASPAWPANWYVSQTGSGAKNGTDPANAWNIFSIDWGTGGVEPGDTLYVVGTITGAFNIMGSGSTDNYITITEYDSSTSMPDIEFYGADWIKLTNLKINGKISLRNGLSENVWLDHLTIDGLGNTYIVRLFECNYVRVSYCTITNGGNGIWNNQPMGGADNYVTIDHCVLTDFSGDGDSHCIGFYNGGEHWLIEYNDLSYANTGITLYGSNISNNIIRYNNIHHMEASRSTATQRGYGIGFEGSSSSRTGNYIYGNIIHSCTGNDESSMQAAGIRTLLNSNANYIYNNTVYDCSPNFEIQYLLIGGVVQPTGGIFKNNISISPNDSSGAAYQCHVCVSSNTQGYSGLEFNNNLYYPDGSTLFGIGGSRYNFADWKDALIARSIAGADANSLVADPLFTNASGSYDNVSDFTLKKDSPAIDKGEITLYDQ